MKIYISAYTMYDVACEVTARELEVLNDVFSRLKRVVRDGNDNLIVQNEKINVVMEVLNANTQFIPMQLEEQPKDV